jgi:NAD(P)H-hydrate epimerase
MSLTRAEARELDRWAIKQLGIPGVVLMENAGRGMAELLLSLGVQGTVANCCGKGNNGGDGFVIARHLDGAGIAVKVHLFGRPEDVRDDAAINLSIIRRTTIPWEVHHSAVDTAGLTAQLGQAEWVVDALFGSGLQGPVRPPFDQVIAAINTCGAKIFAVDIPSGLDSDTGQPLGPTVRAHHTATVVALKRGFARPEAREWLGEVHVVGMGLPAIGRSEEPVR